MCETLGMQDERCAIETVVEQATRVAVLPDLHEIVRVTNAAYRVEDFFITGNRTSDSEVAAKMTGADACFLVIDAPTGGLAASVFVEIRGDRGYFGMLAVDPAHQKTGLSRVLIDDVEARCRAAGCVALDISVVNLREELPAFYARLGFTPTGTAPLVSHHTTRDAHFILMSRPIREAAARV